MKIAVFYHLPFGGAKRVIQEQIKGLRELGHTIDLYSTEKENDIFDPGLYSDNEYIYHYQTFCSQIPFIQRIKKDFDTFYTLQSLHKKIALDIDQRQYDIVLVHSDTYTQAPFILRFLKTKNVYFCLEPLRMVYEYSLSVSKDLRLQNKIYEQVNRSIRKKIDRENARSATFSIAISLFGREYMIHAFDLYPKICYLGVDEKLFHKTAIKKKKQVLFVAEKEYIYGYDLAEKAINLIPPENRPELKIVFGTKKTQRVTDLELVQLYNQSLVTLSLSRFDTFGLVPLESMACSTPVIGLNVAGYRETIIDKKTGFLVDFDEKEIAKKIMLFNSDEALSESMGEQGRKSVLEKWTWKKQIQHLERLLIEFIS